MNVVFLRSVHHGGYIKANDQWGVCVGGGGGGGGEGGGGVMSRHQSFVNKVLILIF